MKRFLLDTGIASDFVNRRRNVFERAREKVREGCVLGICTPVLGELWGGIQLSESATSNAKRLMHALSDFRIWPFDKKAAEEYGRLYAE